MGLWKTLAVGSLVLSSGWMLLNLSTISITGRHARMNTNGLLTATAFWLISVGFIIATTGAWSSMIGPVGVGLFLLLTARFNRRFGL